ncbi:MAG: allantoinase, partial [Alphaproteobacteria bacterium]|nr:allantoinase [Alphaproteobacteria bacterium]
MSSVDLLFVGGEIFSAGRRVEGTLGVQDGRIAFISSSHWTPSAKETIDVSGKLIVPGFIDTHVH